MPSMNILMKAGCGSGGSCEVAVGAGADLLWVGEGGSSSIWLAGLWIDEAAPPTAAMRVRARASIASGWEKSSIWSVICESGTREYGSPEGSTTAAATGTSL